MSIYLGDKRVAVNPDPTQYASKQELNQKASVNADNFTSTGKRNIIRFAMPDYSSIVSVVDGSTSVTGTYTAPSNGFVSVDNSAVTGEIIISVNNSQIGYKRSTQGSFGFHLFFPVNSGDSVYYKNIEKVIFIPCKGA